MSACSQAQALPWACTPNLEQPVLPLFSLDPQGQKRSRTHWLLSNGFSQHASKSTAQHAATGSQLLYFTNNKSSGFNSIQGPCSIHGWLRRDMQTSGPHSGLTLWTTPISWTAGRALWAFSMLAAACLLPTMVLQKLKGSSRAREGEEAAKQRLMRRPLSQSHEAVYSTMHVG